MKKVLLSLAVAAFLVSCGGAEAPAETSAMDALSAIGDAANTLKDSVVANADKIKEVASDVVVKADSLAEVAGDSLSAAVDTLANDSAK